MYGPSALSAECLRSLLIEAVNLYSDLTDTVFMNFPALADLADNLQIVTVDAEALDSAVGLAVPIANLAHMIYSRSDIVGSLNDQVDDTDPRMRRLRSNFAIECAVHYARSYLYDLSTADVDHDQVVLALVANNWEYLVQVFAKALHQSQMGTNGLIIREPEADGTYSHRLADRDEIVIDNTGPIREPVTARKITAESYLNLQSAARQGQWTSAEVMAVQEEHLFPDLHPELVYHSNVVTAEDWMTLHKWVHDR